jgi:hypothetical protein
MKVILIGSTEAECQTLMNMLAGVPSIKVQEPLKAVGPTNELKSTPVPKAQPEGPKPAAQPAASTVEVAPKKLETNNIAAANPIAAESTQIQINGQEAPSLETIRNIAQSLIEGGKRDAVREVLVKYNSKTVAAIDPANFAAVLADLKTYR